MAHDRATCNEVHNWMDDKKHLAWMLTAMRLGMSVFVRRTIRFATVWSGPKVLGSFPGLFLLCRISRLFLQWELWNCAQNTCRCQRGYHPWSPTWRGPKAGRNHSPAARPSHLGPQGPPPQGIHPPLASWALTMGMAMVVAQSERSTGTRPMAPLLINPQARHLWIHLGVTMVSRQSSHSYSVS